MEERKKHRRVKYYIFAGLWLLIVAVSVFPIWFVLTGSFMNEHEILARYQQVFFPDRVGETKTILHLFPTIFSVEQYYQALLATPEFLHRFWNSMRLLVPILLGQLFISAMTGYAMAKFRFPMKRMLTMIYMLVFLMPIQVTLLPNFLILQHFDLIGSRLAVILPAVFNPFGTFWMYQFCLKIPNSTFEMARVEGASELMVFRKIAVPQMLPALAALGVMTTIDVWNMVEQLLNFLQTQDAMPLSVTLSSLAQMQPTVGFAYCTVYLLPILFLFLMNEEYFVDGIVDMII